MIMSDKNVLTAETVQEQEAASLCDSLCDGSLELTDEFLNKYAGERVKAVLMAIPEASRRFHLDSCIEPENCSFNGFVPPEMPEAFILPCAEIEIEIEPGQHVSEDFTLCADQGTRRAYLYVGYGVTVPVDCEALAKAWCEWNDHACVSELGKLRAAVKACVPDLKHYVSMHGPGPDKRLESLLTVMGGEA